MRLGLLRHSHSWLKAEDGESERQISLGTLACCIAMYICFLNNLVFAGFDGFSARSSRKRAAQKPVMSSSASDELISLLPS